MPSHMNELINEANPGVAGMADILQGGPHDPHLLVFTLCNSLCLSVGRTYDPQR